MRPASAPPQSRKGLRPALGMVYLHGRGGNPKAVRGVGSPERLQLVSPQRPREAAVGAAGAGPTSWMICKAVVQAAALREDSVAVFSFARNALIGFSEGPPSR